MLDPATSWQRVANRGTPADGKTQYAQLGDHTRILLVRREGKLYAIQASCGHMRFPLGDGKIEGTVLTCPLHKARFDLITGAVVRPAHVPGLIKNTRMGRGISSVPTEPLQTYAIEERADGVYLRAK